jgi:hypothetical protein
MTTVPNALLETAFHGKSDRQKNPDSRLVDGILLTKNFKNASLRSKLLKYLFENRHRYVSSDEIMDKVFGLEEAPYLKDENRVRERVGDLRRALEDFALTTDLPVICSLPEAVQGLGYKLEFKPRNPDCEAVRFWKPHMTTSPLLLVYAEPVFFYDIVTGAYMRFRDVNPRSDDRNIAIEALDARHGEELRKQLGSSLEARLRPTRSYVGVGEIAAVDVLSEWFSRSFRQIEKEASERVFSTTGCPILLGSTRTNKLIDCYLGCEEGRHFHYRLHTGRFNSISIASPSEHERASLAKFTLTDEGDSICAGNAPTLSQARDRLVIVHRMFVPGTKRTVTMISSEATLGIKQVALALTEDDQLAPIIERLQDQDGILPSTFELLFSVRIAPAEIQHEAGLAEFLCCRKYA